MTQKDVADALGVSVRTVSAWETHTQGTSAHNRQALANLLGGSPWEYDGAAARQATADLIDEARSLLADARQLEIKGDVPPYLVWLNEKSIRMLEAYLHDPDHPDEGEFRFMMYSAHQQADYWARQPGGDPYAEVRARAIRFYDAVIPGI